MCQVAIPWCPFFQFSTYFSSILLFAFTNVVFQKNFRQNWRIPIYFITTMHRAETTEPCTIRRRNQDGSRLDVPCPPLLPDYQQYMRGVDRGDQLVGFYNVGRRSRKWWKRCFSYLLECSLLNAYVLHGLAYPHLHQAKGRKKI